MPATNMGGRHPAKMGGDIMFKTRFSAVFV